MVALKIVTAWVQGMDVSALTRNKAVHFKFLNVMV